MTGYQRDDAAIASVQRLRFFPQSVAGGHGVRLRAEDGRSLLDLSGAWGAASLGYGHPALVAAVTHAVADPAGASVLSSANAPATALAERLLNLFPAEYHRISRRHRLAVGFGTCRAGRFRKSGRADPIALAAFCGGQ